MKNQAKLKQDLRADDGVITLWIDSYNDIFSDFDPRPFSERVVSEDFITQVKHVSQQSNMKVNMLKVLVPEGSQKEEHEKIIKKRLQTYFQSIAAQLKDEHARTIRKGIVFTLLGVLLMVMATYISFLQLSEFKFKLLLALFEPGGWFLLWTGLDLMISNSWSKKAEKAFFSRFENIHVEFSSYK